MRNRRKIVMGLPLVILCAALTVAFWPEKPEPVYKGRKLSELLMTTVTNAPSAPGPTFNEVVHAVGTNAFPLYLEWLQYEPGVLLKAKAYAAEKCREWLKIRWWPTDIKAAKCYRAEFALATLGNEGHALIPQFEYMVTHSTSVLIRERAMTCLGDMHPSALPILLTLMTNKNADIRRSAVLRAPYFNSDPAFRARVIELRRDPDAEVRDAATNALEWIKGPTRVYIF